MMAPYVDYESVYNATVGNVASSPDAFAKAIEYLRQLRMTRHHLDAPLYIQRYEAIVITAAKAMANDIVTELDTLTKLSSSRLKSPSWSILADINAEYLLTVDRISSRWLELARATDDGNKALSDMVTGVAARYFSTRSSLLHHFFTNYAAKQRPNDAPSMQEYLFDLIKISINCLAEERKIATRFFAATFAAQAAQFRYIVLPV